MHVTFIFVNYEAIAFDGVVAPDDNALQVT